MILGVILAEGDDQNSMEFLAMDWGLAMAIHGVPEAVAGQVFSWMVIMSMSVRFYVI